ncbi:Ser-Asp rich fibrinogen-binding, bone sialoprotein-binding protein [Natrinema versiforme JCM 10478]|uniref:Ser-Asp rich fibrinogen-binding, bone sialoprotein-binding protein n=1 Tax=Natrinema versiforme JCM 10478 TaxID=1227496 RepID=L9XQA7_9EURY|nr:Ser-Asp rich fibrinogen-binding, bone sialoprotein-binding protein [Natrinema versiforme JCM 10478]
MTAVAGLAGCVENLQEHYQGSFQGLVPIEVHSESDRHYDLTLEAYETGTNRQTYDESYTVTANESASLPHLDATEQLLRVTRYAREDDDATFEEVTITSSTKAVTVRLTDEELILDIDRGEGADEASPAGEPGAGNPETNESEPIDDEPSDGDPNETTDETANEPSNESAE